MNIEIIRDIFTSRSTLGRLTCYDDNGNIQFSCFTLEDVVRPAGVKIDHETAIPEGEYKVAMTFSQRFQRPMPLIYNQTDLTVKDEKGRSWNGIRIHTGNTESDTEGCILVGANRSNNQILDSRRAFAELIRHIPETPIVLTIQNRQYE